MTNIPAMILTADRQEETLCRTIRSLKRSGFTRITVYCDNNTGVWPGYQALMREAISIYGDKQPILLCEDDIVLCQGVHDYIRDHLCHELKQDVALITLYMSQMDRVICFPQNEPGLHDMSHEARGMCGALAWLWNPSVLSKIAYTDDLARNELLGTDYRIRDWIRKHQYRYLQHLPSLVQHTGHGNSTYNCHESRSWREADTFPGEDAFPLIHANAN